MAHKLFDKTLKTPKLERNRLQSNTFENIKKHPKH